MQKDPANGSLNAYGLKVRTASRKSRGGGTMNADLSDLDEVMSG